MNVSKIDNTVIRIYIYFFKFKVLLFKFKHFFLSYDTYFELKLHQKTQSTQTMYYEKQEREKKKITNTLKRRKSLHCALD